MKKSKIVVLSLITAAVVSLLTAACDSGWMDPETGELATVTIRLASSGTSRRLVDTSAGGEIQYHVYHLIIKKGNKTQNIVLEVDPSDPNKLIGTDIEPVTSATFIIQAYGNPDEIWGAGNHPFSPGSETMVLRAMGVSKEPVTIKAGETTTVRIDLYTVTEASSWEELVFAAAPDASAGDRMEWIILRPQSDDPDEWYADSTISIDRSIRLFAANEVTIIRESGFDDEFFNVYTTGELSIGQKIEDKEGDIDSSPITLDGGMMTATSSLISSAGELIVGKDVTLQRNKNSGDGGGVSVTGGTTKLYGKISDNIANNGGAVKISGGNLILESGAVIGGNDAPNTAINGGGIYMAGGDIVMEEGVIIGGNVADNGGGVYIKASATFTMNGGTIGGDFQNDSGFENYANISGGGVYIDGGIFNMNDGEISYNTSASYSVDGGGGVHIADGTFVMNGGTIKVNETYTSGGGVFVDTNGIFSMNGLASIESNTADHYGGGVFVIGFFFMSGGTIGGDNADAGNKTIQYGGGGVAVFGGTFAMGSGTISNNTAADNGGGVSIEHIGVPGSFPPAYIDGTFTMNGGTISNNIAAVNGGGVFVSEDQTFFMISTNPGINPIIEGNTAYNGGGVYLEDGIFKMSNGAAIIGNEADPGYGRGGGLYVRNGNASLWSDAFIGDNQAKYGGGVYMDGPNSILTASVSTPPNVVAIGSAEKPNRADYGGGVYLDEGYFTMAGGTITFNEANNDGGGVYVNYGTFDLSSIGDSYSTVVSQNSASPSATIEVYHYGGTIIRDDGTNSGNIQYYSSPGNGGW